MPKKSGIIKLESLYKEPKVGERRRFTKGMFAGSEFVIEEKFRNSFGVSNPPESLLTGFYIDANSEVIK